MSVLSAYERQRDENIARNKLVLKSLGLLEEADSLRAKPSARSKSDVGQSAASISFSEVRSSQRLSQLKPKSYTSAGAPDAVFGSPVAKRQRTLHPGQSTACDSRVDVCVLSLAQLASALEEHLDAAGSRALAPASFRCTDGLVELTAMGGAAWGVDFSAAVEVGMGTRGSAFVRFIVSRPSLLAAGPTPTCFRKVPMAGARLDPTIVERRYDSRTALWTIVLRLSAPE